MIKEKATGFVLAGLWLLVSNLPLITLSAPIKPDEDYGLDEKGLRAYIAQVQTVTGGRSAMDFVRRRLYLSPAGLVLMLATVGIVAGTLWKF
jgi:hypothetical protein